MVVDISGYLEHDYDLLVQIQDGHLIKALETFMFITEVEDF
jgi:hypothetical protein